MKALYERYRHQQMEVKGYKTCASESEFGCVYEFLFPEIFRAILESLKGVIKEEKWIK